MMRTPNIDDGLILPQELHELVLQLREDLVALRTSADHMEEKLKAEILFLKEQIQAEQCLKPPFKRGPDSAIY